MASAWLLEKHSNGRVEYLTVVDSGYWGWSIDVDEAFRMSREKDAQKLAGIIEDADRVTEHEWVGE